MKIAILGAGALGSVIGAFLTRANCDVQLWDINQEHLDAIGAKGLIFDGPEGSEIIELSALKPKDATQAPDLIILLTKTIHTASALSDVARFTQDGCPVLTLQNGIGNAESVAQFLAADQVLYGCTMMPGRMIAPGHVATQGKGAAVFRGLTEKAQDVANLLQVETDGFRMDRSSETDRMIWQKAAFNCAMNASAALTGARVGQLADSEGMKPLLHAISAEVISLANAQNIGAQHEAVKAQIERALAQHTEHKPSMLQDIEAGRDTEIESLCGEVARQAMTLGVDAPLNTALAALIRQKTAQTNGGQILD
ncbi:MAG: 2-dehydropantoate 2-reductase [Pseudomonadota bacterium]